MFPSDQRNYDRRLPVEKDSDDPEYKAKIAAFSKTVIEEVKADDEQAAALFNDAIGYHSDEQAARISRAALAKDATALLVVIKEMIALAVRRDAEKRYEIEEELSEIHSDYPMIFGRQA
jgi:hypothetical protein